MINGKKRLTMIDLKYPYGKSQIYMGGSTIATMARFIAAGFDVEHINLNTEDLDDPIIATKIENSDFLGVSLIGAPYIPSAIELAKKLSQTQKPVMFGGQVIERLTRDQFSQLFVGTTAKHIVNDLDIAGVIGTYLLPNAYVISHIPAWEALGREKLKAYMSKEMTMVVSQGCHFQCAFCAASKAQREQFKTLECFSMDMRFLARTAIMFGIKELQFYATSLDFFQNPKTVFKYLQELAEIQIEYGIKFKVRCLSCASSFIEAVEVMGKQNFRELLASAGLWCVGFGVDGADPEVWKAQKKRQNNLNQIKDCLDVALEVGVRSEILLVMGFPQDNFRTLKKCVINSIRYVRHWPNTMLRPYLAKELVPGNDGWKAGNGAVQNFISNPKKFYNLDFCAIGSKSTDARFWHRLWSNLSYLMIIGLLTPFGKCVTSPLLPQGNSGLYGRIAKFFNRIVPFDR